MKQLWKKLVLCVLTLALCCNLVPMAFAADASYYNVYLEAQGGTCDVMQLYAYKYGSNYRLTSTPTPTMEGYKFDGWYDDVVGGTKTLLSCITYRITNANIVLFFLYNFN